MINDGGANGFDLDSLRLSQDFGQTIGVKKTVLQYPIRRPGKQEFVRTHPSGEYRFQTATLELKDDGEIYMVAKSLWDELAGELRPTLLLTTINTQGTVSLWPVPLPGEDGRHNSWHRSALDAAGLAETRWVRLRANRDLGGYDVFEATGTLPDPQWPECSLDEILRIAFKDSYFINDRTHPVLRRLRGEL